MEGLGQKKNHDIEEADVLQTQILTPYFCLISERYA